MNCNNMVDTVLTDLSGESKTVRLYETALCFSKQNVIFRLMLEGGNSMKQCYISCFQKRNDFVGRKSESRVYKTSIIFRFMQKHINRFHILLYTRNGSLKIKY